MRKTFITSITKGGYEVHYNPVGFESGPEWPIKVKIFDLIPVEGEPQSDEELSLIIKVGRDRNSILFPGDSYGELFLRLLKEVPSLESFEPVLTTQGCSFCLEILC